MNEHEKQLLAIANQFLQSLTSLEDHDFDFVCSLLNSVRYRRANEKWKKEAAKDKPVGGIATA